MGERRLITSEDLIHIHYLEDPQIHPDGTYAAYVQQKPSLDENTYHNNLFVVSLVDGQLHPLTYSNRDTSPRWSPDGKRLAFISTRGGTPQLYVLPFGPVGGEACVWTQHINGISAPAWSPDSQHIAYLGRLNAAEREAEASGSATASTAEEKKKFFDPLIISRIPYRDGTTYHDDRHAQLYVMPAQPGAKPRRLTNAEASYTQPVWSPDGRTLYTTRAARAGADEYWRYANLFAVDTVSGAERALLPGEHTIYDLDISPDGTYLSFNRRSSTDTISQFEFTLLHLGTGELRVLNHAIDRPIGPYRWITADTMIAAAATEGRSVLYRITTDGRTEVWLDAEHHITGLSARHDEVVVCASTHLNPGELLHYDAQRQYRALTHANDAFLASVCVQPAEDLWFTSPYGRIQGWMILPPGYEKDRRYPLALNIHGGPQFMWGRHERTLWHEWQTHAAQGYVVFYCNPRGSEGYGNAFNHALMHNWGELVMEDIMAGVDAVIATGTVDPERLAITGGSFGGFATAWIIAHTQRFKAAVTQRGVYNLISFYSTTDIPTFAQTQFDLLPWENHEILWQKSPLAHSPHIQTPLLIIHSENDFRVSIEQAEQLFAWLHRMGKVVRLVRFPREGHELTRSGEPAHRIRSLTEMIEWWNAYIQPDAPPHS
jgi:dipeptidyl aminopeptidase/acylaminoacyl peptidase